MTVAIRCERLGKIYAGPPPVTALKDASFEIADNEFFTLLGPSGCGKTTLLRLIAGFEDITSGALNLFDEDISALPPERRPVNTVFQHYALFPHMTVLDNIAFGLRRQGKSDQDAKRRAKDMLDLVRLPDHASRKPDQLSGGQQQRVALARALAPHPRVLLLDEPLSALDLKLRQAMRLELKRMQRETGITFVFVTHDQEEALAMSDRIAVMSEGEVQQISTPDQIYEFPANRFVADFIGDANFFDAAVQKTDSSGTQFSTSAGLVVNGPPIDESAGGKSVTLAIRPEKVSLDQKKSKGTLAGTVTDVVYSGGTTDYRVQLESGGEITARAENHLDGRLLAQVGEKVHVKIDRSAIRVLSK